MDRQVVELSEKLTGLLKDAAEVSVALDRLNGTIQGGPHYSVIELRAHELGRQLNREMQQRHMAAVVIHQFGRARCLAYGAEPELEPAERQIASIDDPLDLPELKLDFRTFSGVADDTKRADLHARFGYPERCSGIQGSRTARRSARWISLSPRSPRW